MRTISFRGKRIDNGEWVYGFYGKGLIDVEIYRHFIMVWDISGYFTDHEVDPETVGQWTGLWDSNTVDVYEGDLTKGTSYLYGYELENNEQFEYFGEVVWHTDGGCRWMIQDEVGAWDLKQAVHRNTTQCITGDVIGNVHDNPDLLEVKA